MKEVTEPTLPRAKPRVVGAKRQTQPWGSNPYANGGFSIIPRRGNTRDLRNRSDLRTCAFDSPLRLLSLLPDLHPGVGLALWNVLRLTCKEGDVRIVAVKDIGKDGPESMDETGTAAIEELWNAQPSELGGLTGILEQLMQQAMLTGMVCVEAVPGGRMAGVARVWPVDSLTISFHRDKETGELLPLQRQIAPKGQTFNGLVEINADTFFWRALDSMVDEPYGRAPYATACAEVLADIALIQDLRDAVHNAAWPRMGYGFNFTELHKVATEVYNLTGPDATNWVQEQFNLAVSVGSELKPDDNVFYDSNGDLKIIEGSKGFTALESILTFLRQRLVQSLKTLPTLMGINDGSTQTYTNVEWQIYAAGIESARSVVTDVLVKAANLHLRLRGMNLKAVAKVNPIRTTDDFIEAQAEQLRIANEITKVRLGWTTNEDACVNITKSGPTGEPMPGAYDAPAPTPAADPNKASTPPDPKQKAPKSDPGQKPPAQGE